MCEGVWGWMWGIGWMCQRLVGCCGVLFGGGGDEVRACVRAQRRRWSPSPSASSARCSRVGTANVVCAPPHCRSLTLG